MVWNKDKITWQREVSGVKFYSGTSEFVAIFLYYFFCSEQQCPYTIKWLGFTLFPFQFISL